MKTIALFVNESGGIHVRVCNKKADKHCLDGEVLTMFCGSAMDFGSDQLARLVEESDLKRQQWAASRQSALSDSDKAFAPKGQAAGGA